MARHISISFNWPQDNQRIHEMRNFGEDLYRAFKDDGWAEISLDEIDKATDHLRVTVFSARRARRINAIVNKLLNEHFLAGYATVSVTQPP
jgi:hypothetical protein